MDVGRFIRKQAQSVMLPLLGMALSFYFAYHLVVGDRGVVAWTRLNQQIRDAKAQAATIHEEREALEHRVADLRPDSLDPDLLDEQARQRLNLVAPGETVILDEDQTK